MHPRKFLEKHGKPVAERVAKAAGTNYAYFSQIAYGHRRPSPDLALRLVKASGELQPKLDVNSLLFPKAA
jgi:hypothetical protein